LGASEATAEAAAPPRPRPARSTTRGAAGGLRIVGVGGGKGGIGKSLVSASIGIELARRGNRVVLVDVDLGGANLHTCLGIDQVKTGIGDFIEHRVEKLEDVLVPTGVSNLSLASGASDQLDIANPKHQQKLRLLRSVQNLDADYAILDIGSGTSFNVLDFFLVADHGILTLIPEPTSVENAYRFLKAAFYRRLRTVESVYGLGDVLAAAGRAVSGALQGPRALLSAVRERDTALGDVLEREMRKFRPRLVVNMARTPGDREVGEAVVAAWRKYFGLEMDYLGCIGYDDDVWRSVRAKKPLLLEFPGGETAHAVGGIVDRLLQLEQPPLAVVGESP
jgi:flagellar biosynthesis protein FlhG